VTVRVLARLAVIGLGALAFAIVTATTTSAATSSTVTISSTCSGTIFCFKPGPLTVTDGTTVMWSNSTGFHHTVTRCSAAACSGNGPGTGTDSTFTTGSVAPNGSFSHTFHGTGTYNYYCQVHGYAVMHGTITVKAPK
jgi:plastocyanin